jgi:hypothetical protein
MTCDVAGLGSDSFVVIVWYGWFISEIKVVAKTGGGDIERIIKALEKKHDCSRGNVIFDSDGIGGLLGGETGFLAGAKRFANNSKPPWVKRENFANLKSFCAFKLANKINGGGMNMIVLQMSKYWERVVKELGVLKGRNMDDDSRTWRIISKDEMKGLIGYSPDILDALLMRMYFEYSPSATGFKNPETDRYVNQQNHI